MNPIKIALIGAGGKMGSRILDHLGPNPAYSLRCVETGPAGLGNLERRGILAVSLAAAVDDAEVAILALPDRRLGEVAAAVVPRLPSGSLVITLDPAAIFAGELPARPDLGYFVSHPCHPSVFDHFESQLERDDFFGGTHASHAIVCALEQGTEDHYNLGEMLARNFYAPVTRAHRLTVAQMAVLEPAMAETCGIALIMLLREALKEAVRCGVPRAAAEDFMYGHIKVPLGIAFERVNFPFSDGAKLVAEYGRRQIIQPDWKKVFSPASIAEQVQIIVSGALPPVSPTPADITPAVPSSAS